MVCCVADLYILYSYSSCIPDCPLHIIMQERLQITDCIGKGKEKYIYMPALLSCHAAHDFQHV